MPFAVFVEHSVRVVHPAVERSVVIGRTEFFTIACIEGIGNRYVLPAGIFFGLADRRAALRGDHIEQNFLSFIVFYFQRHGIVDLRLGQTHAESLVSLAVDKHVDRGLVIRLLDREYEIFTVSGNAHKSIVDAEMFNLDPSFSSPERAGCSDCRGCNHRHHDIRNSVHILLMLLC